MTRKIEEILVTFIVKSYNGADELVGEQILQPAKFFRGQHINPWDAADELLKKAAESDPKKES